MHFTPIEKTEKFVGFFQLSIPHSYHFRGMEACLEQTEKITLIINTM
jgi:hypothetical protein